MKKFNVLSSALTFTTLLCIVVVTLPHTALAYDAAADFSIGSNPNGVWSYGWSATPGSAFNLDSNSTMAAAGSTGIIGWYDSETDNELSVLYNSTANPIPLGGPASNTIFQPGQLGVNPGFTGKDAIVRWTAPSSGRVSIAATFSGLSIIGASSDVHILLNGVSIFDSAVNGTPSPTSYSGIQNITTGDHIDFAVGFGGNGNNFEDTTVLAASIVAVNTCPNIIGTWTGQVNVANPSSGYSKTTLSLHVTDQNTNGCLLRGYLNIGGGRGTGLLGWFNAIPFTGVMTDAAGLVFNFGKFGQGSAILDTTQTPAVMKKFILLSTVGGPNGSTAVGDLTQQPSNP